MASTVHVEIHRSQFPDRLQAELEDCLRARRLNHKFHYESHKQVQRWLALHEAHSPARTDPGVEQTYDAAFQEILEQATGSPAAHVISLGCGGGQKDLQLLRRLEGAVPRLTYSPVDVSVGLALTARNAATTVVDPTHCHPLVCDLASADDLPEILASVTPPDARRIILFFGMLPNFEPDEILERLRGLLRDGDLLLCSANLAPGDDYQTGVRKILPQYDNAATREWLAVLPNDLGIEINPNEIDFSIAGCEGDTAVLRIEAACKLANETTLRVGDREIGFEANERLRLFFSCRYTPALLADALKRHKLGIARTWLAASGEEGVFQIHRA